MAAPSAADSTGPVERVVHLIEDLKANLLSDAKIEQQIYDRYACWCANSAKDKAAEIHDLNDKTVVLSQQVLELKSQVAVLAKEILDQSNLIAENEAAQAESTAVRTTENGEYMKEKGELETAINALERGIKVLSGAGTKTGLLQASSLAARKQAVASVLLAMPTSAKLGPDQFAAIQSFAEDLEPEAADASSSNAPQSATVQGILKDMYDSFTSDLEKNTQDEAAKQRAFEDLTAGLISELNSMNEIVVKKEEEKATATQALADTEQELDDTKAQLDADIEFFDLMKGGCLAKAEEWDTRKANRVEELKGINEALEILTGDAARELFAKSIKPGMETSLLQLDSVSSAAVRATKAYDALKVQAKKAHSLRLASIAASIRMMGAGHFDKVIKEIDGLIQELKDEEAADIKQRDWCKDEYQQNSEEKAETKWLIEKNSGVITKLENTLEALIEDITATENEIQETNATIARITQERTDENAEFIQAKKDDELAIQLLTKTVQVLSRYHNGGPGPAPAAAPAAAFSLIELGSSKLAKEPEFEVDKYQAPEATFSDKSSRKNESNGIVGILTMIIEDLHAEITNGVANEAAAQTEFEEQLAAANKLVQDLTKRKEDLKSDEAKTREKEDAEQEAKATNEKNLAANEDYLQGPKGIKPDCDWILNSFEERREKRKAEADGLVTAKEYLSGAAPPAMVQTADHDSDDNKRYFGFESLRR